MNQYTNKYTEEDYKRKCDEFGVTYIGTERDKHTGVMIKFICDIHRDDGIQMKDWSHFRAKKRACTYCSGRKRTTDEAQKMVLNPNIEFLSEYTGSEKPIKCICHKCNTIWTTNRPIDLFKRENGCPTCAKVSKGIKRRKPQQEFEDDLHKRNSNIDVIGKYISTHKYVKCRCKIDGCEWKSIASNLLNGSAGCPVCNSSVGENNIVKFLERNNISYKRQMTFDGCVDVKKLRFDVYDITNNVAIEFQGEQHYSPIDFSGEGDSMATKYYDELQRRDKIKKDFCIEHGIKLICIPYWERNNVDNYLSNYYEGGKFIA